MTQTATNMIDATIEWYVSFMKKPEYSDRANGGMDGFGSVLATFTKMSAHPATTITDEQIKIFSDELRKYATPYAERKGQLTLDVDWAPEYPLSKFLCKAQIPNTFFPSKTVVWLDFQKETVTTDWRGETTIYPKEKAA